MTNSDLIYLFIDGETTEVERDILFKELANNNDLQIEFQDALKLNKATAASDFAITPPIALTGAIFTKAGLTQVIETTAIVGGATATGSIFKELFATLNTKFAVGVISAVMASVASFTILSTFYNDSSSYNNSYNNYSNNSQNTKNIPITQSKTVDNFAENKNSITNKFAELTIDEIKNLPYVVELENKYNNAVKNISSYKGNISNLKDKISGLLSENKNYNEIIKLKTNENNLLAANEKQKNENAANIQNIENSQNNSNTIYQNTLKIYESKRLNSLENQLNAENIKIYNEDNNPKSNLIKNNIQNNDLPNLITKLLLTETNDPSLLLEYRGITGLEYFPQRIIESDNTTRANNIALSALLKHDENVYYGFSGGQEDFPIYILNQNQPNFRNSLIWGAVNLRYYPEIFKFENFTPYIETSIGGTQLGPMNKSYLGISWEPIKDVNLNVATEGSLMSYRNNGSWKLSGKLGLNYGISLKF